MFNIDFKSTIFQLLLQKISLWKDIIIFIPHKLTMNYTKYIIQIFQ